jgi:hypothetical protein
MIDGVSDEDRMSVTMTSLQVNVVDVVDDVVDVV